MIMYRTEISFKISSSVSDVHVGTVVIDNRRRILVKTHTAAFISLLINIEHSDEDSGLR